MNDGRRPLFRRGWQWPWLVVAALSFTVGANVVMLFAASGDRNGSVVEPDYYRKAVDWDRTMERQAASDRLGWTASAAFERAPVGGERDLNALVVNATDRTGEPVRGARFVAVLIHNLDAAHPRRASLAETSPGRYEAQVPLSHVGMWEVRLEGRREAERFIGTLRAESARLDAPAPPPTH